MILGAGQWTPAPWINVIANLPFGFQVSESGSGHTWSPNSRENQLTPWSNDPVTIRRARRSMSGTKTVRVVGPDSAANPRGDMAPYGPTWPGLQPLRAHVTRGHA